MTRIRPGQHHVRPRRIGPRRLRSLSLLPTVLTLSNLTCGFAAIHFALRAMYDFGAGVPDSVPEVLSVPLPGRLMPSLMERIMPSFLAVGAGLVILGMLFDAIDGLTARVTRSTTNFGGQLDSLADVITFGVAPATLMVAFMTQELARDAILPSPVSSHFIGRAAWVSAAVYVAFTAVRLARFNVEHAQVGYDHRTFRGLPSPGAACVIVALILVQNELGAAGRSITVYSMPIVAALTAFLMVSRIPYRRIHRAYLLGRRPFSRLITLMLLVSVAFLIKAPALLVLVLWYAASGPLFLLVRAVRSRTAPATAAHADQPYADARKHA